MWASRFIVDVHPDRPDQRGILTPFDNFAMLPPDATIEAIEAAGGTVTAYAEAHSVGDLFLASGDIPRQTSYETGLPGHHTWRGGQVTLDEGIHDERFLSVFVRGQGTTVLTACSHAGVVNVGLEMRRLLPEQPIGLLLGGFHWRAPRWRTASDQRCATSPNSSNLESSLRGTAQGGEGPPRRKRLRPIRFAPSVVGTCYLINAS